MSACSLRRAPYFFPPCRNWCSARRSSSESLTRRSPSVEAPELASQAARQALTLIVDLDKLLGWVLYWFACIVAGLLALVALLGIGVLAFGGISNPMEFWDPFWPFWTHGTFPTIPQTIMVGPIIWATGRSDASLALSPWFTDSVFQRFECGDVICSEAAPLARSGLPTIAFRTSPQPLFPMVDFDEAPLATLAAIVTHLDAPKLQLTP